jgi:hypothetical protein
MSLRELLMTEMSCLHRPLRWKFEGTRERMRDTDKIALCKVNTGTEMHGPGEELVTNERSRQCWTKEDGIRLGQFAARVR